jgi:hypothetical protein
MTLVSLVIHEQIARQLRVAAADPLEVAGVLLCGLNETDRGIRLLGREFHAAPGPGYLARSETGLDLRPAAYLGALSRAETIGAIPLFVHTHPRGPALMSPLDDEVDEDLRPVFQLRSEQHLFGSLVLSLDGERLSFSGRLWLDDEMLGPIAVIREIGERLRYTSALDVPDLDRIPAAFDRQVRAYGTDMQRLLSRLHVAVVGGGGTGSAVFEQLVRLGVGEITVIDFDTVTDTNVTRVYGSGMGDIGRAKVDVLADHASHVGLGTRVHPVTGAITSRQIIESIRDCDLVFACTDDHSGRVVLARFAYWMLVPVFDLGALVDTATDDQTLIDLVSRVDVQIPGTACVVCRGLIDQSRVQAEQLSAEELARRQAEDYAPNLDTPDPAVITYTTLAACLALDEFLRRLTGIAWSDRSRALYQSAQGSVSGQASQASQGHWCANPATFGRGVESRLLDLTWVD